MQSGTVITTADEDIFEEDELPTQPDVLPRTYDPFARKVKIIFRPCTDIDNAERLLHYHGDDLRYCYQAKRWFYWDGRRWAEDKGGYIDRCAEDVARKIMMESAKEESKDNVEKKAKWALATMQNNGIKNMIERAKSKMPIQYEEFDQDPYLLNCLNGTIDLRTGNLWPHQRDHYITKLVPISYDPKACCPHWNDFLVRTMGNQDNIVAFLQRAVGYALTGDTREQVMFILWGGGSNGKSTFLTTLLELISDYGQQTPTEALMQKKASAIPNDIARLRGSRFVSAVETEEGRRLSEVLVKQLTGGDIITARFLNQEFFEFKPEFKIFMATNHKPVVRGTDDGIWRRLPLIPFQVKFWNPDRGETGPDELQADKSLTGKLREELPGILAWAVRGCQLWQEEGLNIPAEVRAATDEYRAEMDTLADFLSDRCVVKPEAFCKNAEMYAAFTKWAEESGEPKMSQKALTQRLKERNFEQKRSSDGKSRLWVGIGIITDQQELGE